jgi:hypothetical protein
MTRTRPAPRHGLTDEQLPVHATFTDLVAEVKGQHIGGRLDAHPASVLPSHFRIAQHGDIEQAAVVAFGLQGLPRGSAKLARQVGLTPGQGDGQALVLPFWGRLLLGLVFWRTHAV